MSNLATQLPARRDADLPPLHSRPLVLSRLVSSLARRWRGCNQYGRVHRCELTATCFHVNYHSHSTLRTQTHNSRPISCPFCQNEMAIVINSQRNPRFRFQFRHSEFRTKEESRLTGRVSAPVVLIPGRILHFIRYFAPQRPEHTILKTVCASIVLM